jgi:hypothetical protein
MPIPPQAIAAGLQGLATLGAAGINVGGQGNQIAAAKEHREDLQDFQYQYTKDRWKLNREGLEAAGYNPLLALGVNPNAGGPVSGMSPGGLGEASQAVAKSPGMASQINLQSKQGKATQQAGDMDEQRMRESVQQTANMKETLEGVRLQNRILEQNLVVATNAAKYADEFGTQGFGYGAVGAVSQEALNAMNEARNLIGKSNAKSEPFKRKLKRGAAVPKSEQWWHTKKKTFRKWLGGLFND